MVNRRTIPAWGTDPVSICLESPIGFLSIVGDRWGVARIDFDGTGAADPREVPLPLAEARRQLAEYLSGQRREFSLTMVLSGTPFQLAVWEALARIPYGETRSYGAIAVAVGKRGGARAVGGAVHANPLSIVLPCHRVVGQDGTLTGFGGGLWRKEWLLAHEQAFKRPRSRSGG